MYDIFIGRAKLSAPAALLLSRYFSKDPLFLFILQLEADFSEALSDEKFLAELQAILKSQKPLQRRRFRKTQKNRLHLKRRRAAQKNK